MTSEHCLTTQCGSERYVAPEILKKSAYGTKVDMWSLGVIIYFLLGGELPFAGENQKERFQKIVKGQYDFNPVYWKNISQGAKDLISKLLTVDPNKRISAHEALSSSWIRGGGRELEVIDLGENLENLRKFNARRKLKQAILTVCHTYNSKILEFLVITWTIKNMKCCQLIIIFLCHFCLYYLKLAYGYK